MSRHRIRTAALALCATAVLTAACDDGLFVEPAPASSRTGVALTLLMGSSTSSGGPRAAFDKVDGIHVRLTDAEESVVVLDTIIGVSSQAADVEIVLHVPSAGAATPLTLSVEMRAGENTLFHGSSTVVVATGETTEAVVVPEPVAAGVRAPGIAPFTAIGDSLTLRGAILFASGDTIAEAPITFTSSNPGIVEIVGGNRAYARGAGEANITATSGTFTATTTARVAQTVGRMTITPSSGTVQPGRTVTLVAATQDRNGNPVTGRTITWTSSHPNIATVVNGVVTGVTEGEAIITAASEGVSATADFVVAFAPVARVVMTRDTATIFMNATIQLSAQAIGASGDVVPKPLTWSTFDPLTASVSGSGVVTGLSPGVAEIVAQVEGKADTTFVTVLRNPVASVRITPRMPAVAIGDSVALTLEFFDAQGRPASSNFSFGPHNPQIVQTASPRAPNSYWIRGLQNGQTYYVLASDDGPRDSVLVTVTGEAPGFVFTDSAAVTSSSAVLYGSNDLNGNAAQYWFEYSTSSAFTNFVKTPTRTQPAGTQQFSAVESISALTPNTTYHFRMVVMIGGARYVTFSRQLRTGIPLPPSNIVAERRRGITAPYIGIGFDIPAGWSEIERSVDGVGWNLWIRIAYGGSGAFNTVDTTSYSFRVRHCNTLGCSAFSAPVRAPDVDVNEIRTINANTVEVRPRVTTYAETALITAEVSTDSFFVANVLTSNSVVLGPNSSVIYGDIFVSGLSPGTRYFARVSVRTPSNATARQTSISTSVPVPFTFNGPAPIPGPPAGLHTLRDPGVNGTGFVGVRWQSTSTGWTEVERSHSGSDGTWNPLGSVSGNVVRYEDAANAMFYRIRHCSSGGCSAYTTRVHTLEPSVLGPFQNGQTSVTMHVSLSTADDPVQLRVEASTSPTFQTIASTSQTISLPANDFGTTHTFQVNGLASGTLYYFRARAAAPLTGSTTALAYEYRTLTMSGVTSGDAWPTADTPEQVK